MTMEKTNVMRILEQKKIKYNEYFYGDTDVISGVDVARVLNEDPNKVFKTLVTVSKSKQNYVFMVPVHKELDLKKCAQSVNEKSIEMIPQKELLQLTGYVHGGCSPIGLKKPFKVIIDSSAKNFNEIIFSAGKIGYQVEVELTNLEKIIKNAEKLYFLVSNNKANLNVKRRCCNFKFLETKLNQFILNKEKSEQNF